MKKQRSSFTGQVGFVLAAAGSAVGLGNIWRFPYLAARCGGGIFLLVYIILAVTFGFALMLTEVAIGRRTRLSTIGAYSALDQRFHPLGWLASAVPTIIVPYYCVIGGWVTKYFCEFLIGNGSTIAADADGYFDTFITASGSFLDNPMPWFLIFLLATALCVLGGVDKGIEKVSTVLMPILIVLSVIVAVFSLTRPGAMEGVKYYLLPDFSQFSAKTVLAAMGQLFYSMSIAMGIMITYGSYMKKEDDLEKSIGQIELFDTGIAFLAGLMIIPAVFAFSGGDESALGKGPGLMFVTLPRVFDSMELGRLAGSLFFLLVLFAALTSAISLLETVVSIVDDKAHWGRRRSTIVVTVFVFALGSLSCYGYGSGVIGSIQPFGMAFLDFFDFLSNSVIMPVVAFLTCILIGWIVGTKVVSDEVSLSGPFRRKRMFEIMVRWVAPICLVAVLASSVLENLGFFSYGS